MTEVEWFALYGLCAIFGPMLSVLVSESFPARKSLSFTDRSPVFLFEPDKVVSFTPKSPA